MSKNQSTENTTNQAQPKDKSGIKLLGSILGLIGAGGAIAVLAVPSADTRGMHFEGPFHLALFEGDFVANVSDNQFTRFVKTSPEIEYDAYSSSYALARLEDPLFGALLQDSLGALLSSKSVDDIWGATERTIFRAEVLHATERILFIAHLGNTRHPLSFHEESGLRPGLSYANATFRGRFHDHTMIVSASAKTLQLDGGEPVPFEGTEEDLFVEDQTGEGVYVDVSQIHDDFNGEISVGVHGRIRQVFLTQHVAQ